jgi:hypothetical protein
MAQFDVLCKNFFNDNQKFYTNVLMSWNRMSVQNKHANKQQFVNYIINTKEFTEYYNNKFLEYNKKLFDIEQINNDEKLEYLKTIQNNSEFNLINFQNYFKSLNRFDEHYSKLFNSLYSHYSNQDLTNNQSSECLNELKNLDLMNCDIKSEIEKIVKGLCHDVYEKKPIEKNIDEYDLYFKKLYEEKLNIKFTDNDIIKFNEFVNNKYLLIDLYIQSIYKDYDNNFNKITNEFFKIFGREITVYEFKIFYDNFKLNPQEYFNSYKQIYDVKYKIVNNLYKNYYGKDVDYMIFSKLYLEYINDNDFENKIIDFIVNTPDYKNVMVNKIIKIYKESFELNINNQDVEYIFNKIYLKKYHLNSDDLIKYVSELKQETDNNLKKLSGIYMNILNRDCEESEKEYYINYFRDERELLPEVYINEELYESLEYNDVLKEKINSILPNKSTSVLFKSLKIILENDDKEVKKDIEKIKSILNI